MPSISGRFPTLKEMNDFLISEALKQSNGNQGIAASMLGITRQALNSRLKKGDRIVFLETDRLFDVITNAEWLLDNEKIKKVFNKSGFDINIDRRQGNAWEYIFISGRKTREPGKKSLLKQPSGHRQKGTGRARN